MTIYRCNDCRIDIEEELLKNECPVCGGVSFTKMQPCMICGDPTEDGLCDDCYKKQATDTLVYDYGKKTPESVKMNAVLAMEMTREEMETVLTEYLERSGRIKKAINELRMNDVEEIKDIIMEEK